MTLIISKYSSREKETKPLRKKHAAYKKEKDFQPQRKSRITNEPSPKYEHMNSKRREGKKRTVSRHVHASLFQKLSSK